MDQRGAPGRKVGAALGLLSVGAALGVAELASVPFGSGSSPILAVGGAVIDLSPHWLKTWAIATFGTSDKAVLLAGIGVVLAVVAAVVGVASLRRSRSAVWALAVLGAAGGLAAWARPTNGLPDALPAIAGTAAGVVAYRALRAAAGLDARSAAPTEPELVPEPEPAPEPAPATPIPGYDRRRFLWTGVAVAGLAVVGGGLGRVLSRRAGADASRASALIPQPTDPGAPIPAGADLGLEALPPFVTPNDRFYRVDTALFVPAVDAAEWRLRIHGMVDHEIELTYEDLLARPLIERDITLMCVSNEVGGSYIGNARWVGARLDDLLREAGVHHDATQIVTRSVDGFTIGTPTAEVMDGRDAMLAVAMNGEPLPLPHGFPVRMLVPGLYGYVSAMKWIVGMELSTFESFDAYWVQRGWAQQAPIKIGSRIDMPRQGASVGAGEVVVAGIAWAQHVGVAKVEIQVDGGGWVEATLADQDTVDTWRQWVYRWPATPGPHRLTVRATNLDGEVQTASSAPPFPDGATGHHTVSVTIG